MPTKYLILRTDTPVEGSFVSSNPMAWGARRGGQRRTLDIETLDGHERDAGELRADPRNVAVMDAEVTLRLIEPMGQTVPDASSLKQVGSIQMPAGLVAVGAHTTPFTGQGVTVAVLDTGIDGSHPAFGGKALAMRDFTGDGAGPEDVVDRVGHGTHCAATICGATANGVRVGVAPGVTKLCIAKVLGTKGGTLEMLLKGLWWAVLESKASVVSMSLGYDLAGNTKRLIGRGIDAALAAQAAMRQQGDIIKGISTLRAFLESQVPHAVFVAATGNESQRPAFVLDASLPASELLPVGAVGPNGQTWDVAAFSNDRPEVVAPGVDVVSAALGGGWVAMSGTSMATPHVAGVAALWIEKLQNDGVLRVPGSVRAAIKAHAVKEPLVTKDTSAVGLGLVQAPQN
jgi:subtilisin family serine protease